MNTILNYFLFVRAGCKCLSDAQAITIVPDQWISCLPQCTVKPDQTQFQRGEEKKLVKEKNDRNDEAKSKNEIADWIIQKGRVVRGSRVTQKVTTSTSTTTINEFRGCSGPELDDGKHWLWVMRCIAEVVMEHI